jgi:seryl-tRNA synthetase
MSRLEEMEDNISHRRLNINLKEVVEQKSALASLRSECNLLRERRNSIAGSLKDASLADDARKSLVTEGSALKKQLASLESREKSLTGEMNLHLSLLPNFSHPSAPKTEAKLLSLEGSQPFEGGLPSWWKDHQQFGVEQGLLDFATASAVSGGKFVYLRGMAAKLEQALIAWSSAKLSQWGFELVYPPELVQSEFLQACGFQVRDASSHVYKMQGSPETCLIGTSEISLAATFYKKTLTSAELPLRLAGVSHCFRQEAGGRGAANKGLYRLHQFSKVEMFIVCTPEQEALEFERLIAIQTDLYRSLGLHFRIVDMPLHDLGHPAARKIDMEAWMPSRNDYGEISSTSMVTDYQARRLQTRLRLPTGLLTYPHFLNGTAAAIPRLLLCILEQYQQPDGTLDIPEVLLPYMPTESLADADSPFQEPPPLTFSLL